MSHLSIAHFPAPRAALLHFPDTLPITRPCRHHPRRTLPTINLLLDDQVSCKTSTSRLQPLPSSLLLLLSELKTKDSLSTRSFCDKLSRLQHLLSVLSHSISTRCRRPIFLASTHEPTHLPFPAPLSRRLVILLKHHSSTTRQHITHHKRLHFPTSTGINTNLNSSTFMVSGNRLMGQPL